MRTVKPLEHEPSFHVPTGIGDFSWIYSKLAGVAEHFGAYLNFTTYGGNPRRLQPFVELCPKVGAFEYTGELWPDSRLNTLQAITCLEDLRDLGTEHVNLSANKWLEKGNRIEGWLCLKIPVDHHYEVAREQTHVVRCDELLGPLPGPYLFIYTSNADKDRIDGWGIWNNWQWCHVASAINDSMGGTVLCVGAQWDADKTGTVFQNLTDLGVNARMLCGEDLGTVLEAMRRSSYVLSYPSGLGVLADVLDVPALMLMPEGLPAEMCGTWGDPVNLKTQQYKVWQNPSPADFLHWFQRIGRGHFFARTQQLRRAVSERGHGSQEAGQAETTASGAPDAAEAERGGRPAA